MLKFFRNTFLKRRGGPKEGGIYVKKSGVVLAPRFCKEPEFKELKS